MRLHHGDNNVAGRPEPVQGAAGLTAVLASQGLFFYHTRKVGLGLGFKWGSGVFFTHILDEDGKEAWSTPVLYQIHELSLGLLAGPSAHQSIAPALSVVSGFSDSRCSLRPASATPGRCM